MYLRSTMPLLGLYFPLMLVSLARCSSDMHHQQVTDTAADLYEKWRYPQHQNLDQQYWEHDPNVQLSKNMFNDGEKIFKNMSAVNNHLDKNSSYQHDPKERFLSIFSVVQIYNGACNGSGESGICYTGRECLALGGRIIGSCARGFGSCCYTEITCGGSTSSNCTHLVSPNYPGTYNQARTCSMSFTRKSDTCQLRLDFIDFESIPPDELGVCNDDQFTVPGERKFTYLCGTAPANWHFYLDVNGKANPTVFNFLTTATSFNRRFKIKVSMIPCRLKVPCGCGQYFTSKTGTIQSFNYGGFYLAGLDYGICLRKEKNCCTTTLTTVGPSFISCPNDLYKIPVGQFGANSINPALNTQALYCQLNANAAGITAFLAPLTTIPSPQTSVTNGPFTIWHMTQIDALNNFLSNGNCPTCAGFFQTFQHNPC